MWMEGYWFYEDSTNKCIYPFNSSYALLFEIIRTTKDELILNTEINKKDIRMELYKIGETEK